MGGLAPIPLADLQHPYIKPVMIDETASHLARNLLINPER
jgi:hypothetical protein